MKYCKIFKTTQLHLHVSIVECSVIVVNIASSQSISRYLDWISEQGMLAMIAVGHIIKL